MSEETKSLLRLRRLAHREGIKGKVVFNNHLPPSEPARYMLLSGNNGDASSTALGRSAQAARFALRHMNSGRKQ